MPQKRDYTDITPKELGFYYVITDQYPIMVEIVDVGREYVVRYSGGNDVKMFDMPLSALWSKMTLEDFEDPKPRAMVAIFFNTPCVSCGACNQGMTKVGPFVICHDCYQTNFSGRVTGDNINRCWINKDDPKYIEFVEKNKKEMAK